MTDPSEAIELVESVLRRHADPMVLATTAGPVLRCQCAGWAGDFDNPEQAAVEHRRHVADRVVRCLRGAPL